MKKLQNVYLVGPMGAGKTTIGRFLAKELKREFLDTDQEIEERAGVDIAWIFDVEGEAGFRVREEILIEELTLQQGIVLATGGGIVMSAQNRTLLASRGIVIYLQATLEQQLKRMEKDQRRPLLRTENREQVLIEINEIRGPLYQEMADYTFMTGNRTVKAVVNDIIKALNKQTED